MHRCVGGVCVSLIVCAFLTETLGMVIAVRVTLIQNDEFHVVNPISLKHIKLWKSRIDHLIQIKDSPSARGREDLLGQYAIDSHRSLSDKHGVAGKREMPIEDDFKTAALRIADEDIVHTIIDFLSYLKLKEIGALDSLPSSLTSEEISQA
uniref:Galanin peptides n=2 Tax=Cyprinus carpio TaxID=7962 RepID=A0A8C1ATV8_CYPCA